MRLKQLTAGNWEAMVMFDRSNPEYYVFNDRTAAERLVRADRTNWKSSTGQPCTDAELAEGREALASIGVTSGVLFRRFER